MRKSRIFSQKNRPNRHKQLIPKNLIDSRSLKLIMGLTQHNRATRSLLHLHTKKKPPSISAQFQASLNKLLETLRKAEPFFVRCIRSNGDKREMHFDDSLVLQQLRYTGMLQTVRIRRSGYGAKFTFKEFTDQFRVLLPKEISTPQEEIANLLRKMGLPRTSFQIGRTKLFLKEAERQKLQETLHKEVMQHIITLQRWFRACLTRKHYLREREGIITIQRSWRSFRELNRCRAAAVIQMAWRRSKQREVYLKQREKLKEQTGQLEKGHLNKEERMEEKKMEPKPSPLLSLTKPLPPLPEYRPAEGQKTKEMSPQLSTETKSKVTIQPTPCSVEKPKVNGKDQIKPSPAALPRPVSLPVNMSQSGSDEVHNTVNLQRENKATRLRENWKERKSEAALMDQISPELMQIQTKRTVGLRECGISQSLDNVSRMSSSETDSSLSSKNEIQSPVETHVSVSCIGKRTSEERPAPSIIPERRGILKLFKKRLTPQDGNITMAKTLAEGCELASGSHSSSRAKSSATFPGARRNPTIKISRATRVQEQWNASLDREITDTNELRHLDEFLGNQMNDLSTRTKELSETEKIFFTATTQFRDTIKSMYSISNPNIGYKTLMTGYQTKVSYLAGLKKACEVPLVVNLFQSVLDGFIRGELKRLEAEPCKIKERNRRKSKRDLCPDSPLSHLFSTYQVTIMQSCDQCNSFIWGMEKAFMCSSCKMVCHKKCLSKIIIYCTAHCAKKKEGEHHHTLHFGVPVCVLARTADCVPFVLEKMLVHVEMKGLYMEGIYRKSGSACRAKELHHILEKDPQTVCLDNYPIHTITGLVKQWLRELPDPLMTYSLYNDFLYAADLPEESERLRAIYRKLDELPGPNFSTLERIIFHLVKVAKEEAQNRMSANALAIVFAPCILRCPDSSDPFLSMKDINKTTLCVEILINEQTRRFNQKMGEIQQLENAEAMAVKQLKLRRQNTISEQPKLDSSASSMDSTDIENNLLERIKSIKKEKNDLASRLPELDQDSSDAENMDSESLVSSESLLEDHFVGLDTEVSTLKSPRPEEPAKPPNPAPHPRTESRQSTEDQNQKCSVTRRDVQSMCVIQSQDVPKSLTTSSSSACNKGKRRFSDLDIPFIDEEV